MNKTSPIQQLKHHLFTEHGINVFVKRDDLIHPIISGNKFRKLKYSLEHARNHGFKGILSFGGAFSNHIHALAYACKQANLKSLGIIRGESFYAKNPTLSDAQRWGMDLKFVNRETYKKRYNNDYLTDIQNEFPDYYIVPEGGSNKHALQGVAEVIDEINNELQWDHMITPVGSGGTLAGLIGGDNNKHKLIGIAVLKQAEYLNNEIMALLPENKKHFDNWQLALDYHCGGYAKFNKEAEQKMLTFAKQLNLPIEPLYSGKMILALFDFIAKGKFNKGSTVVILHTGGLQGLSGLAMQNKIKANEWPWLPGQQAL